MGSLEENKLSKYPVKEIPASKSFHPPFFVCTYWVRGVREEPPSSDLPQLPPTSQPSCGCPRHPQPPCDSLAQTVGLRQATASSQQKGCGESELSQGDGGGQMGTEPGPVYLSPLPDSHPPSMGCLPAWVAELSPAAHAGA